VADTVLSLIELEAIEENDAKGEADCEEDSLELVLGVLVGAES
jgi:hypothetical protein